MLVCSKKEYLIDFSVNFSVLFYLSLEGLSTYEYYETFDSTNHAEQCFEKKKFNFLCKKVLFYTCIISHIHVFVSASKNRSTLCITESSFSQYSLTTIEPKQSSLQLFWQKEMYSLSAFLSTKIYFMREKIKHFLKK